MKVGHIDCTKDTYDVLKLSVAGPLNKSMLEVIDSGALQLIQDGNGSLSCMMQNQDDPPLTLLSSLKICVFVTGGLAWPTLQQSWGKLTWRAVGGVGCHQRSGVLQITTRVSCGPLKQWPRFGR
jgi:hypothetical protein